MVIWVEFNWGHWPNKFSGRPKPNRKGYTSQFRFFRRRVHEWWVGRRSWRTKKIKISNPKVREICDCKSHCYDGSRWKKTSRKVERQGAKEKRKGPNSNKSSLATTNSLESNPKKDVTPDLKKTVPPAASKLKNVDEESTVIGMLWKFQLVPLT